MIILLVTLLLSSVVERSIAANEAELHSTLHLTDGEVTIRHFNVCVINNNDHEVRVENSEGMKAYILESPMFGLISWACDGLYKGETISFFTCGSCGMYCIYNQYILKCQNKTLSILLAIMLCLLISLMVSILSITVFKHRIHLIYAKIIVHFLMKSDRKRVSRILRYNKATGQNMEVKLKRVTYNDKLIDDMIASKRVELIKSMTLIRMSLFIQTLSIIDQEIITWLMKCLKDLNRD